MFNYRVSRGILGRWDGILYKIRVRSSRVVRVCLGNIFKEGKRKVIIVQKREEVWGVLCWLRKRFGRRRVP